MRQVFWPPRPGTATIGNVLGLQAAGRRLCSNALKMFSARTGTRVLSSMRAVGQQLWRSGSSAAAL